MGLMMRARAPCRSNAAGKQCPARSFIRSFFDAASARALHALTQLLDGVRAQRLCVVAIHARFQALGDVAVQHVGRQREDGQPRRAGRLRLLLSDAEAASELEAAAHRHLQIYEREFGRGRRAAKAAGLQLRQRV